MEKQLSNKKNGGKKGKKSGGKLSRMGYKFYEAVENIKNARLINGRSKERTSTEKITNLIVRHKLWKQISGDIMIVEEEEVNNYGI